MRRQCKPPPAAFLLLHSTNEYFANNSSSSRLLKLYVSALTLPKHSPDRILTTVAEDRPAVEQVQGGVELPAPGVEIVGCPTRRTGAI